LFVLAFIACSRYPYI